MLSEREEGPVYYREIQKNAYLKRIPNEISGSKLKSLGSKRVGVRAMWTQLCVHNGRTLYLEQYPEAQCAGVATHKPAWRARLLTARHVTMSVKPLCGEEYDFLIDTDDGPVRMLAPDWDSMQDWVSTLRNTLHELKILPKGENVYCVAPAPLPPPPPPRAAARDPTSPLPPTPAVPPDRVPGIELVPNTARNITEPQPPIEPEPLESQITPQNDIDISNWEVNPFTSLPSTSQGTETSIESKKLAKICGQNICLDDSLFKRNTVEDDEEFFADLDRISDDDSDFKQRFVVSNGDKESNGDDCASTATNITVIKVSNKGPPHTAIPVMGPETDIFDFDFKQKVTVNETTDPNFVNIVHTDQNEYGRTFGIDRPEINNEYGRTFGIEKPESEYGHLSLTTTVNLPGGNGTTFPNVLSSTSTNLTPITTSLTTISSNLVTTTSNLLTTSSNATTTSSNLLANSSNLLTNSSNLLTNSSNLVSTSSNFTSTSNALTSNQEEVYERLCMASTSNSKPSPLPVKRLKKVEKTRKSSLPNLEVGESTYEYLFLSNNNANTGNVTQEVNCNGEARVQVNSRPNNESNGLNSRPNIESNGLNSRPNNETSGVNSRPNNESIGLNSRPNNESNGLTSVERSRSQNAYDAGPRTTRDNFSRRAHNSSPKREIKNENTEQSQKPIWKRGLTELSLLTRLRSIGINKKQETSTRQDDNHDRSQPVTSPAKVVHRSRNEVRVDSGRRRSSSLSNGESSLLASVVSLRSRQAATLRAEQRRGAALVATISVTDTAVFTDYDNRVWVASWGSASARVGGRGGDRVAALRGRTPATAAQAYRLLQHNNCRTVDILFHRVPLAKIYVVTKRDQETIGLKLDAECNIIRVDPHSGAARSGLPPASGSWSVTEINNRPINLVKGGEEDMNRLSKHGTEVSVLIQPTALVKKLRSALKGNKSLLGLR